MVFQKGGFWRMFPRNENRNEGTFGCSPGTKTGTRVHSHVPPERKPERGYVRQNHPFTKPPFLSPGELTSVFETVLPETVFGLFPNLERLLGSFLPLQSNRQRARSLRARPHKTVTLIMVGFFMTEATISRSSTLGQRSSF